MSHLKIPLLHIPEQLPICLSKEGGTEDFDEIRIGRFTRISFHRTLRIPDDGNDYPLPAGLGRFPIHRVEDFADKVPSDWLKEGGFFLPLYQKEALYLRFKGPDWHPTIAKVCVGRINAITGKIYSENLSPSQQDYVVIPDQMWLDGISTGQGTVNQFVAMPLGQGYTIEAQMTDEEKIGGFQIVGFEALEGRFPERDPAIDKRICNGDEVGFQLYQSRERVNNHSMGIAAGGSIKQQIHADSHGVDTWDQNKKRSITIHLVNSLAYKAITGKEAPSSPITMQQYQEFRIPWYSHYDETIIPIKPPSLFKRIMTIATIDAKRGIFGGHTKQKINITPELLQKIKTPDINEAAQNYRSRAQKDADAKRWKEAIRAISLAMDLDEDEKIDDYVFRSACNYHLGNFKDGVIDATIALDSDSSCVEAITWRALCKKSSGDFEGLRFDADELIQYASTELLGLEMKAEALFLLGHNSEAAAVANDLLEKAPNNKCAKKILTAAQSPSEISVKMIKKPAIKRAAKKK
jgi:hypothetical protein